MKTYWMLRDRLDPKVPNLILDDSFAIDGDVIGKLKDEGYNILDFRNESLKDAKMLLIKELIKSLSVKERKILLTKESFDGIPWDLLNKVNDVALPRTEPAHYSLEIIKELSSKVKSDINSYSDWISLAKEIGKVKANLQTREEREELSRYMEDAIDEKFWVFLLESYNGLFLFGTETLTLNRIWDVVKSRIKKGKRVLLIIVDCMGWDDWYSIRDIIPHQVENGIFAIIPTITTFSRLSIIAGKIPREIKKERLFSTYYEEQEFKSKIKEDFGIENEGKYIKDDFSELEGSLTENYKVIMFIYSEFDRIVHSESKSVEFGKKYAYQKLREIIERKFKEIIMKAGNKNWSVFITSDHGNAEIFSSGFKVGEYIEREAKRCVWVNEPHLVDSNLRERCYVVDNQKLKHLPENMTFLFPNKRFTFSNQRYAITHGGLSLEEVIVPFIEVKGE